MSVKSKNQKPANDHVTSDCIWGARAIGQFIGKPERATFHMLEQKFIPAQKVGGAWAASRSRLLAFISGEAAE